MIISFRRRGVGSTGPEKKTSRCGGRDQEILAVGEQYLLGRLGQLGFVRRRRRGRCGRLSVDFGGASVLVVFLIALWFLIEVAIPLVLFLLYLVTGGGMLSQVINDRHHCKGRLIRALAWALVWATLYTVPLAGIVWYVHFLLARAS